MWSAINLRLSVLLARDLKGGRDNERQSASEQHHNQPQGIGLVVHEKYN